jgi:hypothetical protein
MLVQEAKDNRAPGRDNAGGGDRPMRLAGLTQLWILIVPISAAPVAVPKAVAGVAPKL